MGQITITLPDELEIKIREYARSNDYSSVSDFIRDAAVKQIERRPSYWERVMLVQLMELKEAQGLEVNDELIDALKGGYPIYYSDSEYAVTENEMPHKEARFVQDVLEMHRDLQWSYRKSGVIDKEIARDVLFRGFDGNAGDGHLGFYRFLLKHGYFTTVELVYPNEPNSHMTVTGIYERMLPVYREVRKSHDNRFEFKPLTIDQIQRVLYEKIHPENR